MNKTTERTTTIWPALRYRDARAAIRFLVNAFGSYNDSTDFVRAVSTRSLNYAGIDQPWEPNPLTLWVLARQMVDKIGRASCRERV